MALSAVPPEELVEKLGRTLNAVLKDSPKYACYREVTSNGMPSAETSIPIPHETRYNESTRILEIRAGRLSRLPLEILHAILEPLDVLSLLRFSHACIWAREVALSHPFFRSLREHASLALVALHNTKLLGRHSMLQLMGVLQSQRCVSCAQFGAFLFMPTCERACYECIRLAPRFRVIDEGSLKSLFLVKPESVKGDIFYCHQNPRDMPREFVRGFILNTRANELICRRNQRMEYHSTPSLLARANANRLTTTPTKWYRRMSLEQIHAACVLQGSEMALPARDPVAPIEILRNSLRYFNWSVPAPTPVLNEWKLGYQALCAVPMAYWNNGGQLEHGLGCRGCEVIMDEYKEGVLPKNLHEPELYRFPACARQMYHWRETRMFARAEFLKHVVQCYGCLSRATEFGLGQRGK